MQKIEEVGGKDSEYGAGQATIGPCWAKNAANSLFSAENSG
jgi:hypothetical protein